MVLLWLLRLLLHRGRHACRHHTATALLLGLLFCSRAAVPILVLVLLAAGEVHITKTRRDGWCCIDAGAAGQRLTQPLKLLLLLLLLQFLLLLQQLLQ